MTSLAELVSRWDEENAAAGLLPCGPLTELPRAPKEPSEASLRAVVDIVARGSTFGALPDAERRRYLELVGPLSVLRDG